MSTKTTIIVRLQLKESTKSIFSYLLLLLSRKLGGIPSEMLPRTFLFLWAENTFCMTVIKSVALLPVSQGHSHISLQWYSLLKAENLSEAAVVNYCHTVPFFTKRWASELRMKLDLTETLSYVQAHHITKGPFCMSLLLTHSVLKRCSGLLIIVVYLPFPFP